MKQTIRINFSAGMRGNLGGRDREALRTNHKRPSMQINSLSTSGITSFSTSASIRYKTIFITITPCMSSASDFPQPQPSAFPDSWWFRRAATSDLDSGLEVELQRQLHY